MKQTRLFRFCALLILAVSLLVSPIFAATYYVDATNGNDLNDGSSATNDAAGVGPFVTIGKAVTTAADGDVIMIAAANAPGYAEAVTIAEELTLVGYELDSNTEVKITGNLTINTGADVSIGESGTASFLLVGNIDLNDGALKIDGGNFTINSGQTILRNAGTLDESPAIGGAGALNVTYDGSLDITAGPELVADLKGGTLTNAITAAKTLTINGNVAANNFVQNNAGSTTINGNMDTDATIAVSNAGTLKVTGDIAAGGNFTTANTAKVDVDGTITLDKDIVINHNSTGTFDAAAVVGSVTVAGGTTVIIDNQTSGDLTLGTVTVSPVMTNNGADEEQIVTIQNSSTGDLVINGTITGNQTLDSDTNDDDEIFIYLDADGASGGTVTLAVANSIDKALIR